MPPAALKVCVPLPTIVKVDGVMAIPPPETTPVGPDGTRDSQPAPWLQPYKSKALKEPMDFSKKFLLVPSPAIIVFFNTLFIVNEP